MNRSGPLQRRQPLVARTALKRTGKLKPMSSRQRRRNKELAASRKVVMERANNTCEVLGCGLRAEHVHHKRLRSQGRDDSPSNLAALCLEHHDRCHSDRDWAVAQGLVVPRSAEVQEPERFDAMA